MRVILKTVDIDNIYYDANGYQNIPNADTFIINGYSNQYRTKINFKNVNLPSILGSKFSKNKTFNIKILDIKFIYEDNTNGIINYSSSPMHRTSNIYMYSDRLNMLNGNRETLIGQITNFSPNYEFTYATYVRQYINANILQFWTNITKDTDRLIHIILGSNGAKQQRFLFNCTENIANANSLNNKVFKVTNCVFSNTVNTINNVYNVTVQWEDGGVPSSTGLINSGACNITSLPTSNQWFWVRENPHEKVDINYGLEYTYLIPDDYNIDLTFEIRDLLNNQLQPILNNGECWPSIEIILDIN